MEINFNILEIGMKRRGYSELEIEKVRRAYEVAEYLHRNIKRESGEPYIIHPLSVAKTLLDLNADVETLCAALLHDTIEDTDITKEQITYYFGQTVAILVDGVTKLKGMKVSSKQSIKYANIRKLMEGMLIDIRIILIKLADNLHNLETIRFKKEHKQKENSLESLDTYVPMANRLGVSKIQNRLSNLAFQAIDKENYQKIEDLRVTLQEEKKEEVEDLKEQIKSLLEAQSIQAEIEFRIKNNYQLFQRLRKGFSPDTIPDLYALKIILNTTDHCYRALDILQTNFKTFKEDARDFIVNPKENLYQSLHLGLNLEKIRIQAQIKTNEMHQKANYGYAAFWQLYGPSAPERMKKELSKTRFYHSLQTIDEAIIDNREFVNQARFEIFNRNIVHVYTPAGDMFDLPKGSTPIDYAYSIHSDLLLYMSGARVNGKIAPVNYILQNGDTVQIIINENSFGPSEKWVDYAVTTGAKRLIRKNASCI